MQKHDHVLEAFNLGLVLPVEETGSITLLNKTDKCTYAIRIRKFIENAHHTRHDH